MSNAAEYEKPPPYSPYPQEGVHQSYPAGYQPPPQTQQPFATGPAPGYQSYPPSGLVYPPSNYGSTSVTIQPQEIIIIGTCPACRVGIVEDDYTCLGIFCAIFFFPLGILLCLLLKNRRCSHCGAYFG